MKPKARISVFRRLYLLFAAIMLLIYISFISLSVLYIKQQQKELSNSLSLAVQNEMYSLEDQLETLYELERNLMRDNRLEQLSSNALLNKYEVSQQVLALNDMLVGFESLSPVIDRIQLIIPSREMMITSSRGYQAYSYVKTRRPAGTNVRTILVDRETGGDLMLEMQYPMTFSLDEEYVPDYVIRILLSENYLRQQLHLLTPSADSGAFFMLHDTEGNIFTILPPDVNIATYEKIAAYVSDLPAAPADALSFSGRTKGYWFSAHTQPQKGITLITYRSMWALFRPVFLIGVLITGLLILISLFFINFMRQANRSVNRPLRKIVEAFEQVRAGNLDVRIFHAPQDEFQYIYESFNATVARIGELMEHVREQSALLQNAELLQLQSQINPHFLYNSFHLLRIMAKNEDYETITEFVTSLARYYRFLNRETAQNIVLEKEVEHMQNYIEIQQMRFGDKITVISDPLPEDVKAFRVPKLILQPLIENAYNYGVKDLLSDGQIRIRYYKEVRTTDKEAVQYLHIMVEDNGTSLTDDGLAGIREKIADYEGQSAGHALTNINRRLLLAFGEGSGLQVARSELGGLQCDLVMDMRVVLL